MSTRAFPLRDWAPAVDHDPAWYKSTRSTSRLPNLPTHLALQASSHADPVPFGTPHAHLSLSLRERSRSAASTARERRSSESLADNYQFSAVFNREALIYSSVNHSESVPVSSHSSFNILPSRHQNVVLLAPIQAQSKALGMKAVLKRASVSLKSAVLGRSSVCLEASPICPSSAQAYRARRRPDTSQSSWRRLRRAASFCLSRSMQGFRDPESAPGALQGSSSGHLGLVHLPRFVPGSLDSTGLQSHPPQASLPASALLPLSIPGLGGDPPVIPSNTGAAAKASAALQNEYLGLSTHRPSVQITAPPQPTQSASRLAPSPNDDNNDRESGIGIAVASSSTEQEADPDFDLVSVSYCNPSSRSLSPSSPGCSISRVDFIASLPVELAIQILAHLDATALAAVSRVSRRWNAASANRHVWCDSFLREKTTTFATSGSIIPGAGLGVPAISPNCDWKQVYRARDELDRRWRAGLATAAYLHGHKDSIYCVQFDEHKIITGSRDKTIRVWDMHTFRCRLVIGPPEVLADPTLLLDDSSQPVHFAVLVGDRRTGGSMPSLVSFPTHHKASILCLQYDDEILATGSSDASCILYDIRSGYRPIRRLRHQTTAVLDLVFDARHIVTCSKDATICVWERDTGVMLRQLRGHTGPVNAVQMRGNTIVSCSGDFRVKLWNIDTGKNIREFVGHTKGLACSQFSEDGRYVASAGTDKTIRVWDANTGECLHGMPAHEGLVRSLHIDSVSGRLVSGGYDADIKVFDLRTGDELLQFPRWHQSWVLSAKSDYRRIVSTGQDPKILILDFGADVRGIELLESSPRGHGHHLDLDVNPEAEMAGPVGYI